MERWKQDLLACCRITALAAGRISLICLISLGTAAGCGTDEAEPEPIVPALRPRPAAAVCLAGLNIPEQSDQALALPDALSQTGCFTDVPGLVPAPDVIPYHINSPLWTDGVLKQRFLVVPPQETLGFTDTGEWDFPVGAILIKNFMLELRKGDPASRRSIETRFMIRARDTWRFHSYIWNAEGTDALLSNDSRTVEYAIEDGDTTTTISYHFPDRDGCLTCHMQARGFDIVGVALGPTTAQLNRMIRYENGRQNQIAAMQANGLVREVPEDMAALAALPDPADERVPVEQRARSYLHANCAPCHKPGGWTSPDITMDLRYELTLADAGICGMPIRHTIFRAQGELVLDPGKPDNSNLMQRLTGSGPSMMPPLGRSIADPEGSELVRAWIESLEACP